MPNRRPSGKVIMPSKTESALIAEIVALRRRLEEMEAQSTAQTLEGGPPSIGDATAQKRIEEVLKASEVRYRRLFETAKDGILILDGTSGRIADANPFMEEMLGYSHQELVGKTLWEIGAFKDVAASQDAFKELQNKEYIRYENLPLETRGHDRRQVEFISNVYLVNRRRVIQCNIRDITARKLAEDAVRKVNEELVTSVAELKRHDARMKTLNRMSDLLQSCATRDEAYRVVTMVAGELFPGQAGSLAILHPSGQYLETVAHWGGRSSSESIFSLEECWAMRRGQVHEVAGSDTGLLCGHFVGPLGTGYLCAPLSVQGETLGLLSLVSIGNGASREHPVSERQLALTVGDAIKLCLSSLRLRETLQEQATHDPLTGLFNRRYLEDSLPREFHRSSRGRSPLCVAMLDLDHFKHFNDHHGHEAGDTLMRAVGQVLTERVRKSDIACRYGGEEFAIVMPDSSLEDTLQRAEEVRLLIKQLEVRHGGQLLGTVTASAGVAGAPEHGASASELLRSADHALYLAKQAGRDRVVLYQPSA